MHRKPLLSLCIVAFALGASCVPPLESDDRFVRFDAEETVMGEIQDAGELVVGIEERAAPYGEQGKDLEAIGFTTDVAGWLADELRVDVRYVFGEGAELFDLIDGDDPEADIIFPLVPITEKLVRQHAGVTDPIYIAHQRLLVARGSSVESVEDLEGKDVCAVVEPETGANLDALQPLARVTGGDAQDCIRRIEGGRVDSVEVITGPDVVLAHIIERSRADLEMTGGQLNTEAYGGVVPAGASGWQDYADKVLFEAEDEGRWLRSYEKWFADVVSPPMQAPPDLTVEEAAALYPSDV